MNICETVTKKIETREALIGIIGMGYVGLPLALAFVKSGFHVIGFDVDPAKVNALNESTSYIGHISDSDIESFRCNNMGGATTDFTRLNEPDVILICVPTPLTAHREPDMTYIINTGNSIKASLRAGQLVILESTTYPGTTCEVLKPILEKSGLKAGHDFHLAFSPEREDPGNPMHSASVIPKVVGGLTDDCLALAQAVYDTIVPRTVPVSSPDAAEATKLLENIFRSVNIALVNELKVVFDKMGVDIWEVINAASSKPFGYMPFYPGPGLGGHCIPIDPFYLTWRAREFDVTTRFIELAGEVNTGMPSYVIDKVIEALNDDMKSLKGASVLIIGMAYKSNVDDVRESPALRLMQLLLDRAAKVSYHDPHVPKLKTMRNYDFNHESVNLNVDVLNNTDLVLIATKHNAVDHAFLGQHAKLIVDTRNAMNEHLPCNARVVNA